MIPVKICYDVYIIYSMSVIVKNLCVPFDKEVFNRMVINTLLQYVVNYVVHARVCKSNLYQLTANLLPLVHGSEGWGSFFLLCFLLSHMN